MSLLLSLVLTVSVPDTAKIILTTSPEDNYFMCPILTPRLTERLMRDCKCEVTTTDNYELWLYPTKLNPIRDERIRELIDIIGFDTTHVTIQHEDE
jgi:hypothetical protein